MEREEKAMENMKETKELEPNQMTQETEPEAVKQQHELTKPVEPTLLANMERVVELAKLLRPTRKKFDKEAAPYLKFIADKMDLTERQAFLFSLFMEKSQESRIYISSFADIIGCSNLSIISMFPDAEVLVARKLIVRTKRKDDTYYKVPQAVVMAVGKNEAYCPQALAGLTPEGYFDRLNDIFANYEDYDNLLEEIESMTEKNQQLEFCRQAKAIDVEKTDKLLFYVFCDRFVNDGDDCIGEFDWEDYFPRKFVLKSIRASLETGRNELLEKKVIEYCNDAGFADTSRYRLSAKAKKALFPELNLGETRARKGNDIREYSSFPEKRMFYNPREREQINKLTELLMPENFKTVQARLEENGMRKGFACLFYGSPGTGKTETVYQIARRTGRDLMVIDLSQIKSCWVGESEKNIKAEFDTYREYVRQSDIAPILLFNEADAVLGLRMVGAQRAVDKSENTIQNIILQEMEQLDGIMIATTNLTKNLDKAFERRFIYKIQFTRPSVEAKSQIWKSMIPSMESPLAEELAKEYDFSGGQIENIARKRAVELVINGKEPSPELMRELCRGEVLTEKPERKKIGF